MLDNLTAKKQVRVSTLESLAQCLEALVIAYQAADAQRVTTLDGRSKELRLALREAPQIDSTCLTRDDFTEIKVFLKRIKEAELVLGKLSVTAQAPEATQPSHVSTEEELNFLSWIDPATEHDFSAFVPKPVPHTTTSGSPLLGYDAENLARAVLHLIAHGERGRYEQAREIVDGLGWAIEVEKLRLPLLSGVFPAGLWDKYYKPIEDGRPRSPLIELVLRLYEAFTGQPVDKIIQLLDCAFEDGQKLWARVVPDEDNPTHSQLSEFYNGSTFPSGDCMLETLPHSLACAYRMVPALLATKHGFQSAFDYGGGSGLSTSSLASQGIEKVVLIDESTNALEFARWRDHEAGIKGVEYLQESALIADFEPHRGQYDLGVCTEMLEHVIDVEGTVDRLANLVRPGGLLFQSTSFGLYPHLSHLKPNLRYHTKEDELMASHGFDRVEFGLTIPTLQNQRLYRRR